MGALAPSDQPTLNVLDPRTRWHDAFRATVVGIGCFIIGVGVASVSWATLQGGRLQQLRLYACSLRERRLLLQSYEHFAATEPKAGLTRPEFAALLRSLQANVELSRGGLVFAFAALAGGPDSVFLSRESLFQWADHEGTFLL